MKKTNTKDILNGYVNYTKIYKSLYNMNTNIDISLENIPESMSTYIG